MASAQSSLYYLLKDIEAVLVANTDIKHIDLFHGQDDRPEKEQSFDRPAVLIEFDTIPWDTTHQKVSQSNYKYEKAGVITFKLHFLFRTYDKEIERFYKTDALRQTIDKSIEGLQGDFYGVTKKTSEEQQINDSLEWKWVIIYETYTQEEGITRGLVAKSGVEPDITATIKEVV